MNPKAFYGHHIVSSKIENIEKEADSGESASPDKFVDEADISAGEESTSGLKENKVFNEPGIFVQKEQFKDVFDKLEEKRADMAVQDEETLVLEEKYGVFDRIKDFALGSVSSASVNSGEDKTVVIANLAGIRSRMAAFIIDWTIIFLLSLFVFIAGLRQVNMDYSYDPGTLFSILLKVYFLLLFFASTYFLFLTGYCGKTIGKLIMGIEVVGKDGSRVGFYESSKRWLVSILSIPPLFLGFLPALFNDERQCFHDKVANTVVVKNSYSHDS